jgi:hypothetical protein
MMFAGCSCGGFESGATLSNDGTWEEVSWVKIAIARAAGFTGMESTPIRRETTAHRVESRNQPDSHLDRGSKWIESPRAASWEA